MHFLRTVLAALIGMGIALGSLTAQTAAPSNEGASDAYFRGYMMKGEAERMEQAGDLQGSLAKYRSALDVFNSIANTYPTWEIQMLSYRRQKMQEAITRVEGKVSAPPISTPNPAPAPSMGTVVPAPAPAPTPGGYGGLSPYGQMVAQPGVTPGYGAPPPSTANGQLPSLNDFLRQWEETYRLRVQQLEQQNKIYEGDLLKWQQWYDWARKEMDGLKGSRDSLAQRSAELEQGVLNMQREVEAGRAAATQLEPLKKQAAEVKMQLAEVQQRLAAAEKTGSEASRQLAEVSAQKLEADQKLTAITKQRDDAIMTRDAAVKERDELSAQNLGIKTELEGLRDKMGKGDVKDLLAKNEALKKELDDASKQINTLKGDLTKRDDEIAKLKGQLTGVQTELAALKQENASYQTQVADLTMQLKEVQTKLEAKPGTETPPQMLAENQMLRDIILRQLRNQARQQQAKELIIAELKKTENASKDLLEQIDELSGARVSLTPQEEQLFSEPQLKEALGDGGMHATLIASSGEKGPAPPAGAAASPDNPPLPMPAPRDSVDTLLEKASIAFQNDRLNECVETYEEVLRADPKNTAALIGLGAVKIRAGKFADAEVALKKCLAYDPDNDAAHFRLGMAYFMQNRHQDAMDSFEKSLEQSPKNSRAHHYLGIIATRMGLLDRAEREFKTTLAIDPSYGDADFNLAVLYVTLNPPKIDLARSHYKEALGKGVKPDPNLEKYLDNRSTAVSAR